MSDVRANLSVETDKEALISALDRLKTLLQSDECAPTLKPSCEQVVKHIQESLALGFIRTAELKSMIELVDAVSKVAQNPSYEGLMVLQRKHFEFERLRNASDAARKAIVASAVILGVEAVAVGVEVAARTADMRFTFDSEHRRRVIESESISSFGNGRQMDMLQLAQRRAASGTLFPGSLSGSRRAEIDREVQEIVQASSKASTPSPQ